MGNLGSGRFRKVPEGPRRFQCRAWCKINTVPEKVPEKVVEKVPVGFGAGPGLVSEEVQEKVAENVPEKRFWEALVQSRVRSNEVRLKRARERVPEKRKSLHRRSANRCTGGCRCCQGPSRGQQAGQGQQIWIFRSKQGC